MGWESLFKNASGPHCTTEQELRELLECDSIGSIVTKSMTLEPRIGNPQPRYADITAGSINSTGLANQGVDAYVAIMPHLMSYGKPVIASIAGLSLDDNKEMTKKLVQTDVSGIELNLSCPNVIGKPMVGLDFEQMWIYIDEVSEACEGKPLGLKLPPYPDDTYFQKAEQIIRQYTISHIATINSVKGLDVDIESESPVIKPNKGVGGVGGSSVLPIALYNVRKFFEVLEDKVKLVGVGGIQTGEDVFKHILCGASTVGIGTTLAQEGITCFSRIKNEFEVLMTRKGYISLDEFRGKLKPYS